MFGTSFRQVGLSIDRGEAHGPGDHSCHLHCPDPGLILLLLGGHSMLSLQKAQGELRYGHGGMWTLCHVDWC
jgi:hypothetical protein